MRASQLALLSLLAGATALAACDKARPVAATPGGSTSCTGCHGGLDNATGAPPMDTRGNSLTTVMTVGAHTAHVRAGYDCDACHVKPARVSDPGHIDGVVAVPFGAMARTPDGSAVPSFDPATGLCSNVYCHGGKLATAAQGLATTPVWNGGRLAGADACAPCHGSVASNGAPPSHLPATYAPTDCVNCHSTSVTPGGATIPVSQGGTHINGKVDVTCNSCHGDKTLARGEQPGSFAVFAPPVDASGASSGAKVGAHLRHVSTVAALGSRLSSPFACTECHRVPTTVTASPRGHGVTPVVQFGTAVAPAKNLGTTGGLVPVYTAATGGCATTYCHGASLGAGGTNHAPTWGATGAAACGTCHFQASTVASAPGHAQVDKAGAPFTSNAQCSQCHPGTVKADGTIDLTLGNHVDGVIEAASPHPAPATWLPDHGKKARLNLQGPGGCTSCHGAGFDTVVATSAAGKPESCNTCHANPVDFVAGYTGKQHPDWRTECTFCHGDKSLTRAAVATGPAAADAVGSPAANTVNAVLAAPERGSQDELTAAENAVGAHQRHVSDSATTGNRLALAFRCQECHGVGVLTDAAHVGVGHVDGQVVVGWQLAASRGATPAPAAGSYPAARDATGLARATPTSCTNYCHGATLTGGAASKTVTWTSTGTAGCGTCHGLPPDAPHPGVGTSTNCGGCHAGYDCTAANLAACTVNKTLHVNGVTDVSGLTCTSCHGTTGVNNAPPLDTQGAATGVKVGAHQAHVTGANLRGLPLACADCHTTPTSTGHATGTVDMTWGALARTGGLTPTPGNLGAATTPTQATWEASPTCTNYCHGQQWAGNAAYAGSLTSPRFTDTAAAATACGSCHKAPPSSAAHAGVTSTTQCGSCHTGYTCTTGNLAACTVNTATHLNGALDTNLTCSSCHGTAGVNNAPPLDTKGASTGVKVGAHQKHVTGTSLRAAVLTCADCHTTPTSTGHATGTVDMTWGALARTGGLTPTPGNLGAATTPTQATWEATPTCTNYCHGTFTGGLAATPSWTASGLTCNSCHGNTGSPGAANPAQPPGPIGATVKHPQSASCGDCHASYGPTTVNTALHINGTRDFPAGCTACHGELSGAVAAKPVASTSSFAAPGYGATATSKDSKGNTATTARGVGAHDAHLRNLTFRGTPIACTECHAVPAAGDTSHVTGTPVVTFGALAKTGGVAPVWNGAGGAATLTCSSTYCHGNFTNGANATPTWAAPSAVVCGSCHGVSATNGPGGTHPTLTAGQTCGTCHGGTYTNTSVDPTLHLNGVVDGGGESAGGSACAGCHATIFSGMNGTVAKTTKHTLGAVAGTNDAPTDSGATWTGLATLGAVAPAQRSCTNMCHGDHPHDTTSPLSATHEANLYANPGTATTRGDGAATRVITGGTGTVNRARTDFDATNNVGMCATCHATPIATGGLTVSAATFGASAHDFTATATPAVTWQYTLHDGGAFQRNCTKCHASAVEGTTPTVGATGSATAAVHFGDNAALLSGKLNPAGTAAGFVCYNCHGSTASPAAGAQGNRSNKDIQTQIAKTTGSVHPANADAVHDTAAELAGAAFGNALGGKARHSSCMDCHDPHEAKSGTHAQGTNLAGPPLQGAWGVKFGGTLAAFAAPTTANFTKVTSLAAGTDLEATLCFKCHSAYYGALPTSPSGGFTETDQAREFNPANPSFHPVLASNSGTVGNTGNVIAPWTKTSLMTCTDCHESNSTTDPNGPHGSTAKFILKGPNTTWSSSVASLGNNAWMPAGTFCLNCHANDATKSRFPAHSRSGDHSIACTGCHVLIPHGSGHVGMLVSLPGGAGGTAVTDSAPYAVGVRLGIGSYPSATGTWGNGNCGCDSVSNGH